MRKRWIATLNLLAAMIGVVAWFTFGFDFAAYANDLLVNDAVDASGRLRLPPERLEPLAAEFARHGLIDTQLVLFGCDAFDREGLDAWRENHPELAASWATSVATFTPPPTIATFA